VGYSFGARTIVGALTLLAGGQFAGQALEKQSTAPRAPIRAVLIAAAVDETALARCGPGARALEQVDRVLVTCNPADRALRWYRHMQRWRGAEALGFRGPACAAESDAQRPKLDLVDLGCEVGRNHTWDGYISAPAVRSRLAWYAFLQPAVEVVTGGTAFPSEPGSGTQEATATVAQASSAATAGRGAAGGN